MSNISTLIYYDVNRNRLSESCAFLSQSKVTFSCVRRKDVRITPAPGTPGAPKERITMDTARYISVTAKPADSLRLSREV